MMMPSAGWRWRRWRYLRNEWTRVAASSAPLHGIFSNQGNGR